MESQILREITEEITTKGLAFGRRLASSARSFLETHDLMESVKASSIDEITFLGMVASLQIREWERMGIFDHIPFIPSLYMQVCQNAADLFGKYPIEHLKSMALVLDVQNYYLANFIRMPKVFKRGKHDHSSLWKQGVLAELNPNRQILPAPSQVTDISSPPDPEQGRKPKRPLKRDDTNRTWSEKEVAEYTGYSISTIKRMRGSGEIPLTLYRQRTKGAKVRYYPDSFKAWYEQRQKK